ncbi:hypothetical protein [Streptomyces sp. 891-h]|uniref:hypothetical protein n=1 Tax=Streptomyces sp. 891-h TaxID=2720714 RepID=UPI001FAAEAAF|nr:hypothetical protein [Streptomyces sp. 891-h]UNZ17801.1 hypothetical protein HC362_12755 [Streptomyces sp. 891-h]
MIKDILSPEPEVRNRAADTTTDLTSSYSEEDVRVLVRTLSAAAALESNQGALEAQLHAISEIDITGPTRPDDFYFLRKINRATLPEQLDEYLRDLFEQ